MKLLNLFLSLTCVLVILSCGGDPNTNDELSKIDITDGKVFFVESDKLFKITSNNDVVEVEILNTQNESANLVTAPEYVFNVNSSYAIVTFGQPEKSISDYAYLVDKVNGAAYKICGSSCYLQTSSAVTFDKPNPIYTDVNGNIYLNLSNRVAKLNISNVNNITTEYLSDSSIRVESFAVANDGTIGYSECLSDNSVFGIIKPDGTHDINTALENYSVHFWTAVDGNVYYLQDYNANYGGENKIYAAADGSLYKDLEYDDYSPHTSIKFNLGSRSILLQKDYTGIDDLYTPTGIFNNYHVYIINNDGTVAADVSDANLYISNVNLSDESVLTVCTEAGSCSDDSIIGSNQYSIQHIKVISDNEVFISALRKSDNVYILARLIPNNSIEVLKVLNEHVTTLSKL